MIIRWLTRFYGSSGAPPHDRAPTYGPGPGNRLVRGSLPLLDAQGRTPAPRLIREYLDL